MEVSEGAWNCVFSEGSALRMPVLPTRNNLFNIGMPGRIR